MGSHLHSKMSHKIHNHRKAVAQSYRLAASETTKSDLIKLKSLKDSGASCRSCTHRNHFGLLYKCIIKSKQVNLYNICDSHALKEFIKS